ncbi:integrase core domain-containing protein (plasmid) [Azospirillum sp. A29]
MSRTTSPSTGRSYGLARVARNWAVSCATVYRHRAGASTPPLRGPGPLGLCPHGELIEYIRQQILTLRFHGEGYRKIWGRLRHGGNRTSICRVRRLMGAHRLLAPHWIGRRHTRVHDGTIVTEAVNTMWGTDMTETITLCEGVARVFIAVDHANSEVVSVHAAESGNCFEALEPIRQGVLRHFGNIGPGVAAELKLRHDHGSNYMSGDSQAEIKCLGITSSPSFVREPEGNGMAERFIRTLKENFLWVHTFDTIKELRRALIKFAHHYNETWLVGRHGHRTPAQVRTDQLRVDQMPVAELALAA